jgi:hypothetical protein
MSRRLGGGDRTSGISHRCRSATRGASRIASLVAVCLSLPACAGTKLLEHHPAQRWETAEALAVQIESELPARRLSQEELDRQHSTCYSARAGVWKCLVSYGRIQDELEVTLSKSPESYIQHRSDAGLMGPTSFSQNVIERTISAEPGYRHSLVGGFFLCSRTTAISATCSYPFLRGIVPLPASSGLAHPAS